jgi:hypothetical protein
VMSGILRDARVRNRRSQARSVLRRLLSGRVSRLVIVCTSAYILAWLTIGSSGAVADTCPNAPVRGGPSAVLPDCRAYEQVSPTDKSGYDVSFGNGAAAPSGDGVSYVSFGAFAGAPANNVLNQYLSSRTPAGWSTTAMSPPIAPASSVDLSENFEGFSSDLTHAFFAHENPPFDGATPDLVNLYRRNPDGAFDLLSIGERTGIGLAPIFAGASTDSSHVVFEDSSGLLPGAPTSNFAVYEWVNGVLSLVSVLPDGTPSGGFVGQDPFFASARNAVSADGSRIYWSTGGGQQAGSIFLWENGASTEITTSQCTVKPSCQTGDGAGTYWAASTDGTKALFSSIEQLTNDSTAQNADFGELYQWDATTGQLMDLTVDPTDPSGGDVLGVVGVSNDLSYVYFVANGALASGASAGQPNLYVRHAGTTRFIATLSGSDQGDWGLQTNVGQSWRAQVSADGLHVLFMSVAPLSPGYDNAGHSEVYRYDASGPGALSCISCNPSGAAATGDAELAAGGFGFLFETASLTTVNNMSADGKRAFFETTDALVPQDTNGVDDVYEWEADGTGSCQTISGCVYLVSSGQSSSPSLFEDTTASGNDVFFLTRDQLVGQDSDSNVDVYDARVGGGFPGPPPPPVPCLPEDCHGQPSSAPAAPVAASITFFGPGNGVQAGVTARAKVLSKVVHGAVFIIRVRVPGGGGVVISGAGIRTVHRAFSTAGTFGVRVTLTGSARRALRHKHKLRLKLLVRYSPAAGAGSSATVRVTVER